MSDPEIGADSEARFWRLRVTIEQSIQLHRDHHRLVLRSSEIAEAADPGQFLHVWCHPPEEMERPPCAAILRRPFSISRVLPPDGVELLLRVRGVGGRILSAKRPGETLDVIGPLGRGFRFAEGLQVAVLVAGGVGLALAPFLIQRLVSRGCRVIVLAGATDDGKVPFRVRRSRLGRGTIPELADLGAEVTFVSEAVEGVFITEVFELRLGEFPAVGTQVFAVGPRAMLKRVAEVNGAHFALQVSLEERMACGVGACRSCVVPVRAPHGPAYKTVCRDGPVFDAGEVDWERLEP